MAFIRPYEKRDFEATAYICCQTLAPSLVPSPEAHLLGPYLWTHQYTYLSPETCFVLDDGNGTAVGYCIGCPNIHDFVAAYPSYVSGVLDATPAVKALRPDPLAPAEPWTKPDGSVNGACLAQLAYDPQRLLLPDEYAAVAARFPSVMHINLLETWQRKGWGGKLLERTVGALAERCTVSGPEADGLGRRKGGVWVGVAPDNAKVVPFYQRMGFHPWEDDEGDDGQASQSEPGSQANDDPGAVGEKADAEDGAEAGKGKRRAKGGAVILLVREFLGAQAGKVGGAA